MPLAGEPRYTHVHTAVIKSKLIASDRRDDHQNPTRAFLAWYNIDCKWHHHISGCTVLMYMDCLCVSFFFTSVVLVFATTATTQNCRVAVAFFTEPAHFPHLSTHLCMARTHYGTCLDVWDVHVVHIYASACAHRARPRAKRLACFLRTRFRTWQARPGCT